MTNKTLIGIIVTLPLLVGACDNNKVNSCSYANKSQEPVALPKDCKKVLEIWHPNVFYDHISCENIDGSYSDYKMRTGYGKESIFYEPYDEGVWVETGRRVIYQKTDEDEKK